MTCKHLCAYVYTFIYTHTVYDIEISYKKGQRLGTMGGEASRMSMVGDRGIAAGSAVGGGGTESKFQARSHAVIVSSVSNTAAAPMMSSAKQAIVGPEVFM